MSPAERWRCETGTLVATVTSCPRRALHRCYAGVPTLARHMITETPEVAAALDAAALVWPGRSRADLMRRLITASAEQILTSAEHRHRMVEQWAGGCPGAYSGGWDERRKAEWPA